ncbi:secretagogin [Neolamprologus brichardi]|uniref:secretagogin n=1 Tax=Neolamprologus brichardi TaxID=32507 RepID=UPI0003EBC23A|nr:secretagogin [Neolamprologus brichardi]
MDSAFEDLDAAGFLEIWQHFDADDNGYIEGKELDDFFRHMMKRLRPQDKVTEEDVQNLKKRFMSAYDVTADGKLQIQELAHMILPEDENFLLIFRRENPLDNTVEFMTIWRKYDVDCSGYISAQELKAFLKDLFQLHHKEVTPDKLEDYTDAMMKIFDKNKDGRLDLNDLARILALEENFLLQFRMDSKTGALEGPEVDGFVKDMMGLVRPNITGPELDKLRAVLLRHCDVNKDGKIQRNELALCLGVKMKN